MGGDGKVQEEAEGGSRNGGQGKGKRRRGGNMSDMEMEPPWSGCVRVSGCGKHLNFARRGPWW